MKLLTLLIVCLLYYLPTEAQSLSWFHGDWIGETYFPNGPITKRIIVQLRVTSITGSHFEALLDNLYPNDTTVRLERKIKGRIINKQMRIENSELIYIRDPRTQNFWRDCTGCDIQSAFSINDKQVEIKLKTTNCNDECNGETIFIRDTSALDSSQQKDLAKWFHFPQPKPVAKKGRTKIKDSAAAIPNATVAVMKPDTLQKQNTIATDTLPGRQATQTETITSIANTQKSDSNDIHKRDSSIVIQSSKSPEPILVTLPHIDSSYSLIVIVPSNEDAHPIQKSRDTVSIIRKPIQIQKDSLTKQQVPKADSTPSAFTTRTTNLINTYQVSSPHIVIQLFDNAEIDGDVVTVYHNGQLIVNRQSLTHKAITIAVDASKTNAHHEFVMVADNLGLIPPNTALMRITAGEQKFELEVSSDFDNNSKITIDYTGE